MACAWQVLLWGLNCVRLAFPEPPFSYSTHGCYDIENYSAEPGVAGLAYSCDAGATHCH